jgi:predicted MPP superfamily phosphohydrolase
MKITKYTIKTEKKGIKLKAAVVSDLHARPYADVLKALRSIAPEIILLPGDILEVTTEYMEKRNQNALDFLRLASKIAPCYYTYGNHEIYNSHAKKGQSKTPDEILSKKTREQILALGINILNDSYLKLENEIYIGGLVCGYDMDPRSEQKDSDFDFLDIFEKKQGLKILLCHYPHYYEKYIKTKDIDLVLSGHAHGGQWRLFGRGIYAPHQGIFPKYTSGIHNGRHIISRGAVNNTYFIPRFFNPCEILEINISSE